MPKRYSSAEIEKVAERLGFAKRKSAGNDATWTREKSIPILIPMNKREIPAGTFRSIVRQMGINPEEFNRILKKKGGAKA